MYRRELPAVFAYRFCSVRFLTGDILIPSQSGRESVVAVYEFMFELLSCVYVFMSVIFSVDTFRCYVRHRFWGGVFA